MNFATTSHSGTIVEHEVSLAEGLTLVGGDVFQTSHPDLKLEDWVQAREA